jgi:acetyl-CoA carboxylase biotin carboxyl carrier protein
MSTHIEAPVTGSVWRILVAVGDQVSEDDEVMILESMKMEIPVEAEMSGTVSQILRAEGDSVAEGEPLLVLDAG